MGRGLTPGVCGDHRILTTVQHVHGRRVHRDGPRTTTGRNRTRPTKARIPSIPQSCAPSTIPSRLPLHFDAKLPHVLHELMTGLDLPARTVDSCPALARLRGEGAAAPASRRPGQPGSSVTGVGP